MASAPSVGLKFEINGLKIVYGMLSDAEYGDMLVLAVERGIGANNYSWKSQFLIRDLIHAGEPSDEKINKFCSDSLAEANFVLARDFPLGGVSNPKTPTEKVQAFVLGLQFDPTTNQIKRK